MLDDGLGLVEGFHPPRLGRLACFVFLPYLPDRRPGRGREHARQFVDCDQLRSLLGTVGHLCHGRDIPVVRFAEVVDEAHQQYPLHVQPGAFAGEDGGQQGQPPRVGSAVLSCLPVEVCAVRRTSFSRSASRMNRR